MNILLSAALFLTILLAGMRRQDHAAIALGLQAGALGGLTVWLAAAGSTPELYLAGLLTLAVKGVAVPLVLLRVLRRLERKVDPHPMLAPELAVTLAAGLLVLAKAVIPAGLFGALAFADFVAFGSGMILVGLLMMVTRRQVIAQVEGLVVMENGIYLAVLGATRGMPFVVELGVLFDLLVAVLIMGSLTLRIGTTLDSLNTDRLRDLKG
ncbi:MAG: hypothetical protein M1602_04395 [Firmicutes bacterium]|nr:hypothetical protein [Bacillota bacterium]